jgi:hypothetical protein
MQPFISKRRTKGLNVEKPWDSGFWIASSDVPRLVFMQSWTENLRRSLQRSFEPLKLSIGQAQVS